MSLKIVGDARLKANLLTLAEGVPQETTDALDEVADLIRDDAKSNAPVDTGALKKSISKEKVVRKGKLYSIAVTAGGRIRNPKTGALVNYAQYPEYGTSTSPAQPYLRPAYTRYRMRVCRAIMDGMMKRMKR